MAVTNTEVYRPFAGELRARRFRAWPLTQLSIRTGFKQKWPLIFFAPSYIAAVILSFIVYFKFVLESNEITRVAPGAAAVAPMGGMVGKLIEVRSLFVEFNLAMSFFVLVVLGWYGSGLIADDRRLSAHQLYFARPLSVLDYALAKFLALCFYGSFAFLVPCLIICTIAAFSSPEWSFVTKQGDVILDAVLFSTLSIAILASIVLAISSLSTKKTFALAATFGFFTMMQGISALLAFLQRDRDFLMLSVLANLRRVATEMFGHSQRFGPRMDWDVGWSWLILAGYVTLAWTILLRRVRRMEASV